MAETMNVTYQVPPELKAWIEGNTKYFIGLLPDWVAHLNVDFQTHTDQIGLKAECETAYRYRRVYLRIFPSMINDNESERRHTFIHEACHVFLAPIQEFMEHSVKAAFKGNQPMIDVLQAQWDIANEAAVEDMARAFMRTAEDNEALNETEPAKKEEPTPVVD